jgi:hypothetical protein
MEDRLDEVWERRATEWAAWARTPGHDVHFTQLNWPAFEELLPGPGRLTLDLGCGEGRLGRLLRPAGYRLIGRPRARRVRHRGTAGAPAGRRHAAG